MLKTVTRPGALALALVLSGCSGGFAVIAPTPPQDFQRLGRAEGTGCGTLFVIATAYNFVPVMLNDRVERAYQAAVASVPGATALVNVDIEELWFWWGLGTTRCTTVSGEAIK